MNNTPTQLPVVVPRLLIWIPIILFILLSALQAHKPLHLDNADLPVWAKAVADTGKPIAYRGETRRHDLFVYHTPLYLYTLGGWYTIFGYGPAQTRAMNVVLVLLAGWIVVQIVRDIYGRAVRDRVMLFFWPLFLLNPYTLQCAAIADIDTSIYGPLLSGLMLATVRLHWRDGEPRTYRGRELVWPVVLVALCLWSKLTTILLLLPLPLAVLLIRSRSMRSIRDGVAIAGGGVLLFIVTYGWWAAAMGISWLTPVWWVTSYALTRGGAGGSRIADFLRNWQTMMPFMARWAGALVWFLAAWFLIHCVAAYWRAVRSRSHEGQQHTAERIALIAVVGGLAAACNIYYTGQQVTFGNSPFKYPFVLWPVICGIAAMVAAGLRPDGDRWKDSGAKWSVLAPLLGMVALAGWVCTVVIYRDNHLISGRPFPSLLWIVPAIAVVCAIGLYAFKHYQSTRSVLWSILAFHLGIQTGLCVHQAQQPYSTTYNYGQLGLAETAAFIKLHTRPDEIIFCMKDLGPLSDRKYFESYAVLYGAQELQVATRFIVDHVRFVVATEGLGEDQLDMNPPFRDWVKANCRLIKSLGNYRIYEVIR